MLCESLRLPISTVGNRLGGSADAMTAACDATSSVGGHRITQLLSVITAWPSLHMCDPSEKGLHNHIICLDNVHHIL